MSKRRVTNFDGPGEVEIQLASTVNPNPVIPTHDFRHLPSIREGNISFEIFSQENKNRLHRQYLVGEYRGE